MDFNSIFQFPGENMNIPSVSVWVEGLQLNLLKKMNNTALFRIAVWIKKKMLHVKPVFGVKGFVWATY